MKTRIALICSEKLLANRAGIGIRYVAMAKALHDCGVDVVLRAPDIDANALPLPTDIDAAEFSISERFNNVDLIIAQGHLAQALLEQKPSCRVAVDLYDPYVFGHFSYIDELGTNVFDVALAQWQQFFFRADSVLCANIAQRQCYLGALLASGRVTAKSIHSDPRLDSLIIEVPFGIEPLSLPARAESKTFTFLFGAVYDWYDPMIVLEALADGSCETVEVVFVRAPNPEQTPQKQFSLIEQWCHDNPNLKRRVKIVDWVPFEQRADLYSSIDGMIATHPESLETEFSSRTRLFEAITLGIPIISTRGGEVAELIDKLNAGRIIEHNSSADLLAAIVDVSTNPAAFCAQPRERELLLKQRDWVAIVKPLIKLANSPAPFISNTRPQDLPGSEQTRRVLFSVILPTYNRMDILPEVIRALEQQKSAPEFEVIIINDGSEQDTQQFLDSYSFQVPTTVVHQSNAGPANARNAGIERARGNYLLLLGDDTVPDPYCLHYHHQKHALKFYAPTNVVVGLIDWHSTMRRTPFIQFIDRTGWQFAFDDITNPDDLPFGYFYGSNLSLSRELLGDDRFNTAFPFPAWEDSELGYRLKLKGANFVYQPAARTQHLHKTTVSRFAERQRKAGYCAMVLHQQHPELGDLAWPASESLSQASQPWLSKLRRKLMAILSTAPFSFEHGWNLVLRDHYVQGIRQFFVDQGMPLNDTAARSDQHLLPLKLVATSPLLHHSSGNSIEAAWVCDPANHEAGHIVFGPNLRLHKATTLEIVWELTHESVDEPVTCITLDIYDNHNKRVLNEMVLSSSDIENMQRFTLTCDVVGGECLEFRVFWHAQGMCHIKHIYVQSLKQRSTV